MKTLKPLLYDKGNLNGVRKLIKDNFASHEPVEMGKHSLVYNIVTPTEEIKESYYVVSNNVSSKVESRNSKHPEISGGIARIRD